MIELVNISKSYNRGAVKAVESLNLAVRPGEIFGFLGPNGAGKTTTIKIMVGLLQPDGGTARIGGFDIQKNPLEVKKQIGFVPENPEVYEKITGIEYLNFLGDVHGVPGPERAKRAMELLEMFKLDNAVNDLVQTYSHGMRQKLVLTGSFLHNPPVLIMDEPMVGLDPRSSFDLKEKLQEYCQEHRTVFFSTHILAVAEQFCHRVGIIHQGRLIACGTLEELQKQARNRESLEKIFLELTEA